MFASHSKLRFLKLNYFDFFKNFDLVSSIDFL